MRLLMLLLPACFAVAASAFAADVVVPLQDAGFELPASTRSGWTLTQHAGVRAYEVVRDTDIFREGKQSLRMTRVARQFFGSVKQAVRGVNPGSYRYTAQLRSSEVTERGWGLFVRVFKENGDYEAYESEMLLGTIDWRLSTVDFLVPSGASVIEVGVALRGGGTGWIDDLSVVRLAAP
jgi:opacity protein-like surface antigen